MSAEAAQKVQLLKDLAVHMGKDQFEEAKQLLKTRIAEITDNKSIFRCLLLNKLTKVYNLLEETDTAIENANLYVSVARDLYEEFPEKGNIILDALTCLGETLGSANKLDEAVVILEEAKEKAEGLEKYKNSPRHGIILSMLGNVFVKQGKLDKGIEVQMTSTTKCIGSPVAKDIYLSLAQSLASKAAATKTVWCWDQAGYYYHKVLESMKGPTVQRAFILRSFAECLLNQNMDKEAQPPLQAASRIFMENKKDIELARTWLMIVKSGICKDDWNLTVMTNNQIVRLLKKLSDNGQEIPSDLACEVLAIGQVIKVKTDLRNNSKKIDAEDIKETEVADKAENPEE